MNKAAQLFYDIGEPFAAGFFEEETDSIAIRFCRAYRRFFENCPIPEYRREDPLFPYANLFRGTYAVTPQYCRQYAVDMQMLAEKSPEAADVFEEFNTKHGAFTTVEGAEEAANYAAYFDAWNHAALNYKRIVADGLDRYEERIHAMQDTLLKEALLDVMAGIRCFHARAVAYLISVNAEERLITALQNVPFSPADTAYEALVSCNFVASFDEFDNFGFVDGWFPHYWKGEDLVREMHFLLRHLQDNVGWSIAIGPEYNELTKQWLKASNGLARPMVELRTVPDMPDDIWEQALENILSGSGQPAFYNENAIQSRLRERFPDAPQEDIYQFAGMGCTETNFSGLTYSGGIDVNLNTLKVFDETMREELASCGTFSEFYDAFIQRLHRAQDNLIRFVNNYYNKRAEISFAPIRTLFTDDCIDAEKGYFQGGARYTYAVPSDSGIPNTVDSLLAVRELVFVRKFYSPGGFIAALDGQDPRFLALLKSCPVYGVGNADADALIHDLTYRFYSHYRHAKLDIGSGFLPTSHQFVRHVGEGNTVGHTPDGRKGNTPVADSIAAVNGKAIKGPTLMLKSAASFDQSQIYSIPVLNLSITRKFDPVILRSLIEGYFDMDGTQVQITCVNRDILLKARENPDAYRDLIVRVGGYSEYFHLLSPELQDAVIARTMFEN